MEIAVGFRDVAGLCIGAGFGLSGRELEKGKVVIPINWDLTPPFLPLFSVACFVMLPFPAGPGVPALGEAICVKRWGRRR